LLVLGAAAGLGACTAEAPGGFYSPSPESRPGYAAPQSLRPEALGAASSAGPPGAPVGLLLPLSGPLAAIGRPMRQAAALALSGPGSPALLVRDTGGAPEGAAAAARAVLAGGARLILGPLTAPETAAAAAVAQSAAVPMLAFTNDPAQARPGVWVLGITPGEQVGRLVAAATRDGRTRFAALLPDNPFGRLMADGLAHATAAAALGPPEIRFHGQGMASINAVTRGLSDYAGRWGPIAAQIRAAAASGTEAGRRKAAALRKSVPPPPPFDALLLADTGESLREIAALLAYYVVGPPAVRILGPALWADPRSDSGRLPGAWYAAPEGRARAGFVAQFVARYGASPPGVADLAYDAAAIARVTAAAGYAGAALAQPAGFAGTDGVLALRADGDVWRGLAVFAVAPGGGRLVSPPPTRVPA
jgi:ABC-type branched-subunit amino acid transport system substrate-binding protein